MRNPRRSLRLVLIGAAVLTLIATFDPFGLRTLIVASATWAGGQISTRWRDIPGGTDRPGQPGNPHRVPDGTLSTKDARSALAGLAVAEPGSMTDYARDQFPHWDEHPDRCDTRENILRRDGADVRTDASCTVTSGTWYAAYTATAETRAGALDVDHVVSLADAWRSGAARWPVSQRKAFANDPRNLVVASRSTNLAKRDKTAETWQPPNATYHCAYARITITVKHGYLLSVRPGERASLQALLTSCSPGIGPFAAIHEPSAGPDVADRLTSYPQHTHQARLTRRGVTSTRRASHRRGPARPVPALPRCVRTAIRGGGEQGPTPTTLVISERRGARAQRIRSGRNLHRWQARGVGFANPIRPFR